MQSQTRALVGTGGRGFTNYSLAPRTQQQSPSPAVIKHTCTDIVCLLILICSIGVLVLIGGYADAYGDPRKIFRGLSYQNQLCGVDLPDKPYVYLCGSTDASTGAISVDYKHPICVAECPMTDTGTHTCYDAATNTTTEVQDYPTNAVAKRYCVPQSHDLREDFEDKLSANEVAKYFTEAVATARGSWPALLGAFLLAIFFSYVYLGLVHCFAGVIMWTAMALLIIIPALVGGFLIYADFHGGLDGLPSSGDEDTDLYVGIAALCVSLVFMMITVCMASAINRAIQVIEMAASAIFQMPTMLLEPLLSLVMRSIVFFSLTTGFVMLVSVGKVQKEEIYRSFEYEWYEWCFLIFYVIMFIWLASLVTAIPQFAVAYASQIWYFTEHDGSGNKQGVPCCPFAYGYFLAFSYQLGTLAYGSLVIGLTWLVRMVLSVLVGEMTDNDSTIGKCLASCCLCCVSCYEGFVRLLSKNAYIYSAIYSTDFCYSARQAMSLIVSYGGSVATMHGATWIFEVAGVGLITAACAITANWVVVNDENYNIPSSEYYVEDPIVMSVLAGMVGFLVAIGFVLTFSAVADSLFVCNVVDEASTPQHSGSRKHIPGMFACCGTSAAATDASPRVVRPQYAHPQLRSLVGGRQ